MVSKPSYDPNLFVTGIEYQTYAELRDSEDVPLFNRAVQGQYEPGSTLKPFTVAGLLEHDLAALEDSVDTGAGHWTVAGRTVSDVHPEGGFMTLAHALEISSNVGVAKAAEAMTSAEQYQTLRDFGLGAPTGVGLPGEGRGTLRRPEQWSGQSAVSLAIGYEVAARLESGQDPA